MHISLRINTGSNTSVNYGAREMAFVSSNGTEDVEHNGVCFVKISSCFVMPFAFEHKSFDGIHQVSSSFGEYFGFSYAKNIRDG